MTSVLTQHQEKTFGPVAKFGELCRITATVRYDDRCGNGHNTFSITAKIDEWRNGRWCESGCGPCHDQIAEYFPELGPYIKWHLCSSDGPLHYVANTVYFAGDRDHNGLRAGETRQIRNGKTGQFAWKLESSHHSQYVDADERPSPITMRYVPWVLTGEGKPRDLDAARRCAIWPEATDEDLTAPGLEQRLMDRLPALLADFRKDVESLGFTF